GDADAARGERAAHALRHRHEHRPHAGRGRPAVFGDPRAHPPDRGQGAAQAEASQPVQDAARRPRPGWSRELPAREVLADGVVHALGLALGIAGAIVLVGLALFYGNPLLAAPLFIYAAGLVAMLGCSAAYNPLRTSRRRDWLRRFDHAAIFAMIAGTYTPFTILGVQGGWSAGLTVVIWLVAAVGIALKLWQPRRIEAISVALY